MGTGAFRGERLEVIADHLTLGQVSTWDVTSVRQKKEEIKRTLIKVFAQSSSKL